MQDPRRYFEQTSVQAPGAVPARSAAEPSDQMSTLEVLKAINPHALQSGMTSAAAKQVPSNFTPQAVTTSMSRCFHCCLCLCFAEV